MQIKYISSSANPPGLLRKVGGIVATVALAGVALMFSAVLLAIILIAVVIGGAYLWWKTRELRRQMRDFSSQGAAMRGDTMAGEVFEGEVIEGEAIRVEESRDGGKR
ncbi:MAG: hypothetical protein HY016_10690 [Nitrosomonadales bacterium]|nr:hypothetical protein [Nitrosomonadales bacterium]